MVQTVNWNLAKIGFWSQTSELNWLAIATGIFPLMLGMSLFEHECTCICDIWFILPYSSDLNFKVIPTSAVQYIIIMFVLPFIMLLVHHTGLCQWCTQHWWCTSQHCYCGSTWVPRLHALSLALPTTEAAWPALQAAQLTVMQFITHRLVGFYLKGSRAVPGWHSTHWQHCSEYALSRFQSVILCSPAWSEILLTWKIWLS